MAEQAQLGTVKVGVEADLTAYDKGMRQARQEAEKFDKAANKNVEAAKRVEIASKNTTKEVSTLSKSFRGAADSAAFVTGPLGGVASRITLLGSAAQKGYAGVLLFSTAFTALAFALIRSVNEAERAETSFLRTQAVLKATGNASGFTANQIKAMGKEIADATLASSEGIDRAAQKLLTFKAIQNSTFTEALQLSQDLAAVGFGSIDAAAVQLGKALQDPITGIESLREVGVTFSAVQREQIRNFYEAGKAAEAQAMILATVREQVGGAGGGEAGGLTGAYDQLNKQISLFFKNIGNSGPLTTWTGLVEKATIALQNWNKELFPSNTTQINELMTERIKLDEGIRAFEKSDQAKTPFGQSRIKLDQDRIAVINQLISAIQDKRVAEIKEENAAQQSAENQRKAAEADRVAAEAIEANKKASEDAARAAGHLADRRASTLADLQSELDILQQVEHAYGQENSTLSELDATKRALSIIHDLQYQQNSAEAQQILDLVDKHRLLQESIDAETNSRKEAEQAQKTFETNIGNIKEQAEAMRVEAESTSMAGEAAAAYRVEQELINKTVQDFGSLSSAQAEEIKKVAEAYGIASAELEKVREAQKEAEKQSDRMADAQQRFQEKLADGLTDAIFSAKSAGEAFNAFALEIAKAVIQAEILALIQAGTGVPSGKSGGGGSAIIGAVGAIAGLFGGGGGGGGTPTHVGATGSVLASQMHTGGIGGQDGMRRSANASMFIGAPKFHNGLRHDEFPAILQNGEEVTPKDKVGRNRGASVTNNWTIVTPDPNAFRESRRQINRAAATRAQTNG